MVGIEYSGCTSNSDEYRGTRVISKTYLPTSLVFTRRRSKKRESAKAAVIRELQEEVGLVVAEQDVILLGIYHHKYLGVNDYPVIYTVKNFTSHVTHSGEIEQIGWFSFDALPEMLSPGSKRRLGEYFDNNPISEKW